MAYSTSNPPMLKSVAPLTGAGQTWIYRSTDPAATVDTTGYITNARLLGMKVGDLVEVHDTSTVLITKHQVMTVSTSSNGAADLGTGISIGSSANAD